MTLQKGVARTNSLGIRIVVMLFGLIPYISPSKLPPVSSFWAEWTSALLVLILIFALYINNYSIQKNKELAFPIGTLSMVFALLLIVCQEPLFGFERVHYKYLSVFVLLLGVAISAVVEKYDKKSDLLDSLAFGWLTGLLINCFAICLERNGLQFHLFTILPKDITGRTVGLFGQPNQLASFAAISWCAGQYLWMRRRVSNLMFFGAAVLCGLLLAGATSRTGQIAWFCVVALGGMAVRNPTVSERINFIYAIALACGAQLFWRLTGVGFQNEISVLRYGVSDRIELLRDGVTLVNNHPWFGVGFGNFATARWQEVSDPIFVVLANHSHNLVMELMVDFGIPGATAILFPLFIVVIGSISRLFECDLSSSDFFVIGSLAVLAGHSLTEYPLWYSYYLLPFAFLLGLAPQPQLIFNWNGWIISPRVALILLAISLQIAIVVAFDYVRIQHIYTVAAQRSLVNKRSPNPLEIPQTDAMAIYQLTAFEDQAELLVSRTFSFDGHLSEKVNLTRRVMLTAPNTETVARHILFLVLAGHFDEALVTLDRTSINPTLRKETLAALAWYGSMSEPMKAFLDKL